MYKKIFLISVLFAVVLFTACKSEEGKEGDKQETKVGGTALRNGDLFSEDIDLGDKAIVDANAPGQNEMGERAFENAPPTIPHKTDGFFPITQKNNACLACHLPSVAKAMNATPMAPSHFVNYRPEIKTVAGKVKAYSDDNKSNSTTAKDLGENLNKARYNCEQCHVTQTNATLDVKNNFKAEFRDENAKKKSNLKDVITEGVK